jgi:hypothetical protein
MTAVPAMRDLAQRLLAYEAAAANASKSLEPSGSLESAAPPVPALLVYEKLRLSLTTFAGAAAFEALAFRALTQAKSEAPSLWPAQIAAGGSLQGLDALDPQVEMHKDLADKVQAGDGAVVLIARLLGLLRTFLGETLTLSLLRTAWPGELFDDRNPAYGRNT